MQDSRELWVQFCRTCQSWSTRQKESTFCLSKQRHDGLASLGGVVLQVVGLVCNRGKLHVQKKSSMHTGFEVTAVRKNILAQDESKSRLSCGLTCNNDVELGSFDGRKDPVAPCTQETVADDDYFGLRGERILQQTTKKERKKKDDL